MRATFKGSEETNRKAYEKMQQRRTERRADLIKNLEAKAAADPDGIWQELANEMKG